MYCHVRIYVDIERKSEIYPASPSSYFAPPCPSQTEMCGGFDSFSLYQLKELDLCLRETPIQPYEQVRACLCFYHAQWVQYIPTYYIVRLHTTHKSTCCCVVL